LENSFAIIRGIEMQTWIFSSHNWKIMGICE